MKSAAQKRIEREFAEEAGDVPLPAGISAEALEAEAEARRRAGERRQAAMIEEAEAALARLKTRLAAGAPAEPVVPDVASVAPEMARALERLRAVPRRTEAEVREHTLEAEIFPKMKAWGFEKRSRVEITDWRCEAQRRVFAECGRRLSGVGAVVALIGERGAGKTTIAAQLALARAWQRHRAIHAGETPARGVFIYAKVTDLVRRLKPLYANHGTIDTDRLESSLRAIVRYDTLVIDELHDLSELAVREAMLIDLIDRRYAAERDTLLVSNQTESEWRAQTPASIASRIEHHGCVIPCAWGSWRANGGRGDFSNLPRQVAPLPF